MAEAERAIDAQATELRLARIHDAAAAYRLTHHAKTEALDGYIQHPTPETRARWLDAEAAFRTAVFARDAVHLEYYEHIVARAQDNAFATVEAAVERWMLHLRRRQDDIELAMSAIEDIVNTGFKAVLDRLPPPLVLPPPEEPHAP